MKYLCSICGIQLNSRTTLWRHKKKCNIQHNTDFIVDNLNTVLDDGNTQSNLTTNPHYDKFLQSMKKSNTALQDAILLCSQLRDSLEGTALLLSRHSTPF